jgi:TRAP-type C4-dicarboxylate transport system permease small subunit
MKHAFRALDENAERWAMLVFYAFCCIVIVQEVVRRFVLNYSSAWGEEAARYAFIYLGWIGAAYAVRERAHIRFDVIIGRVGPRAKALLFVFAELATIAFACIALYWSLHTIRTLLQFDGTTPVLRVNKAWFEAAVPIGFALIVFRSVQGIWRDLRDLAAGRQVFAGKAMFEE